MVEQFTIENLMTGEKCSFGCDPSNMFIVGEGGIDFGRVSASHNTYSYPHQSGVSISSTDIQPRTVTITGYACYLLSKRELELVRSTGNTEYAVEKIYEKKDILNKLINPLDEVRINIGDFYINGKPDGSVLYANTVSENNQAFCKFSISIYCYDPMFKAKQRIETILSGSIPLFHFPLVIPQNIGIAMSERVSYHILTVQNTGQIEIGATIRVASKGTISGLEIENILTGEAIKLNKTLEAGEEVLIDTNLGESRGIKGGTNGAYTDYLRYWDYTNSWLQFPVGSSLLGYSVDGDKGNLVDISIFISPRMTTLKEQ